MKAKALQGIMLIFLFLLFTGVAYAQYYLDYSDESASDTYYTTGGELIIPDWYEVSEEEILFCQDWAGTETPSDVYNSAEAANFKPVSTLTITLQGFSTPLYDKTLYEIGWYVQPLSESITYTVYLIDEDGDTEEVYTGYATAETGDASYETVETDVVYTHLQILMEDGSEALKVPIVEKTSY